MDVPFPAGTPLAAIYPDGFTRRRRPGRVDAQRGLPQRARAAPRHPRDESTTRAPTRSSRRSPGRSACPSTTTCWSTWPASAASSRPSAASPSTSTSRIPIGGNTDAGIPPDALPPAGSGPAARRLPGAVVRARPLRLRRLPAHGAAALHDRRDHRRGQAAQPAAPLRVAGRGRPGDRPHRHPAGPAARVRRPRRQGQGQPGPVRGVPAARTSSCRATRTTTGCTRRCARPAPAGQARGAVDPDAPTPSASPSVDPADAVDAADTCAYQSGVLTCQCAPSRPVSRSCLGARGVQADDLDRLAAAAYFVVIASRAATVEASQMCDVGQVDRRRGRDRRRSRTGCTRSLLEAKNSSPVTR